MKSKAAICLAPRAPLAIETVEVEGPRAGEVLVAIAASGVCHTDAIAVTGENANCAYPAILGHEGAGVVVETGPNVGLVAKGDHVIPLYGAECGSCKFCRSNRTNLCWSIRATRDKGLMPDGTSRFSLDGRPVHHFMGTSTFSQFTVVPEIALAKIRPDAPLDEVCLLGCGVTTGVGAALADTRPGDNVAVFGLGGIGMNIIQGARIAGAERIIGIDLNPAREALARRLGATDFIIVGRDTRIPQMLADMTDGGVDVAFECTGSPKVMRDALESCHVGWGTCVLLGVEPPGAEIGVKPVLVRYGRTLKGSYFGGVKGRSGLGRFVDLYMEGKILVDELITHRFPLEGLPEAFDLMHAGLSLRSVILHDAP
jgi:S-(hydroxymethyl)glutathione dehydrogenase/alcohol dehydrogenase